MMDVPQTPVASDPEVTAGQADKTQKKRTLFDEKALTKGELRKLNALRKSLGDEIANRAFGKWLEVQTETNQNSTDPNAELIAEALHPFIYNKELKMPKQGYLVKRGRGRVIVKAIEHAA